MWPQRGSAREGPGDRQGGPLRALPAAHGLRDPRGEESEARAAPGPKERETTVRRETALRC